MENRWLLCVLCLLLMLFNYLDVLFTMVGLGGGGAERIGVTSSILVAGGFGLLFLIKLMMVLGVAWVVSSVDYSGGGTVWSPVFLFCLVFLDGLHLGVLVNNWYMLRVMGVL